MLSLTTRGIRASLVRLPPSVLDERKAGLVTARMEIAKKKRVSAYIADGQNAGRRCIVPMQHSFFGWR